LAIIGLLSLTFGSTLIAFALQVRAQRVLSPSIASLIFLLESPFALIFAIYFLNESMTDLQATGALLIFFSAVGATLAERRPKA
jgi:drug/metabolite transporter (DMT)-like permease